MCLLRYFDRKYMMHTRASDSLMYNEMKIFWARTEYHFEYYMTANYDRNLCIHNAKPFKDETDGKEHSESQNEWSARELIRCSDNDEFRR